MAAKCFISYIFIVFLVPIPLNYAALCGCKIMRECYKDMIDTLKDKDEEACIEDASIGVSTVMIFLKAIKQFCPEMITIYEESLTYEGRRLYEVILNAPGKDMKEKREGTPPEVQHVLMIEAGQEAGADSVGLALFLIEQLIACKENSEMIANARWIILPSVNPDGMEHSRFNRASWKKNVKPSEDGLSYGVSIARNFDYQWGSCERIDSGFSPLYPGLSAASENETVFIKNAIARYKKDLKVYLSLRRDGHGILYPQAYSKSPISNSATVYKVAADVASRVNQRAGGVQMFVNQSIYEANGKAHCGHSVDYAYDQGVPLAYEMRVFLGDDNRIMSKFQQLPRGYESSLRLGYFGGLRELYSSVVSDKRFKKLF